MPIKILIVEDLFIEANSLKVILERAGHTVCGIAKSVDQAMAILKRDKPDMVLLDIFLKGDLTGIHLAKYLSEQNIPFIYLSANSNPSTLEAAKATQPYGFLVKPYREKDILVALDIGWYRHKHALELMIRQEKWLSSLLSGIINEMATQEQKMLLLAKAFKPFVPFDYIYIDTDTQCDQLSPVYVFQRVDFDEYSPIDLGAFLKKAKLSHTEFHQVRKEQLYKRDIACRNGTEFISACSRDKLADRFRQLYGAQSSLSVPILLDRDAGLSITFFSVRPDCFNAEQVELLNPLRTLLATVIENIHAQANGLPATPSGQFGGIDRDQHTSIQGIIGKSPKLLYVLDQILRVASSESTVLITGETGVGKEGLANAIHQLSPRKGKPLIKVNCGAIPESLIESELFGHEKGAFTSAMDRRIGKFEQAQGGTIFLDEIGELPLLMQSKLLRVLQEKEIERLGGRATIKVDLRIIAATNRNLHKEVAEGRFRMDLYYRINVFPINVPPLRDRLDDIPLLVRHFLQQYAQLPGNKPKTVTPEVLQRLMDYSWPGNIRELQHIIERHVVAASSSVISTIEMPEEFHFEPYRLASAEWLQPIADVDKAHIVAVLKKCNGKVSGKGGAAEVLGVNPNTLISRMKRLGISWKYILE